VRSAHGCVTSGRTDPSDIITTRPKLFSTTS
jgi:hypothetical protein